MDPNKNDNDPQGSDRRWIFVTAILLFVLILALVIRYWYWDAAAHLILGI